MDLLEHLGLVVISIIANGLSALAGGGAGLLQFPVLLFLGLSFNMALATHKIASVALGIGATFRHLKEGSFDWKFTCFVLATGLPGVALGASLILDVNEGVAILSLGILTAGLGIYSRFKADLGIEEVPKHRDLSGMIIGGLGLFIIGGLNGSLSSGTGLFVTLLLVRWFGFDYKKAVSYTMLLVGFFWNATGAFTVALQTDPYWHWLPALIVGALIGAYVGAHLSIMKGSRFIKTVFEWVTLLVGIKLLWDGLTILL